MSVYKQLTTADTIVTPFEVNKSFTFQGKSNFSSSNVNIDLLIGTLPTQSLFNSSSFSTTGLYNNQFQDLVYESIEHLYYSNYLSQSFGDKAATASFNTDGTITGIVKTTNNYNYLANTLTQSRELLPDGGTNIGVLTIPRSLFGEYIKPGSFVFNDGVHRFTDDKQGNIFTTQNTGLSHVGNIIYEHGIVVFTYKILQTGSFPPDSQGVSESFSRQNLTCSFDSTKTIYETQFLCNLNEAEYNFSLNPTITSKPDGTVYPYTTGSWFNPYITTVGLYNNNLDLIAVAKLPQPLPKSNVNDTNIVINLDMY